MRYFSLLVFLLIVPVLLSAQQLAKQVTQDRTAEAFFGSAIAVSGNVAVIGTRGVSVGGSFFSVTKVHLFTWDPGQMTWTETQYLTDNSGGSLFGSAVGFDGATIVVGAPRNDAQGSNAGAAYVYTNNGTAWVPDGVLYGSDIGPDDAFGTSVAVDGDYLVVGAPRSGPSNFGKAYVFERQASGAWLEVAILDDTENRTNELFGQSVAVSGDGIAVGSPNADFNGAGNFVGFDVGAVYMYRRDGGTGLWGSAPEQKLTMSAPGVSPRLGSSVTLNGSRLLSGAPNARNGTNQQQGAAFVFDRNPTTGVWAETQRLVAPMATNLDVFGAAVALDGDLAIVGAHQEDEDANEANPLNDAGSAYVFRLNDGTWNQTQKLVAGDRAAGDIFGYAVALSGERAIIGAPFEEEDVDGQNPVTTAGSAYLFDVSLTLMPELAAEAPAGETRGDLGTVFDVGGQTASQTIFLTNNGNAAAENITVSVSGTGYTLVTIPQATLAAGTSTDDLVVRYTPTQDATGPQSGTLTITYDNGSDIIISLSTNVLETRALLDGVPKASIAAAVADASPMQPSVLQLKPGTFNEPLDTEDKPITISIGFASN